MLELELRSARLRGSRSIAAISVALCLGGLAGCADDSKGDFPATSSGDTSGRSGYGSEYGGGEEGGDDSSEASGDIDSGDGDSAADPLDPAAGGAAQPEPQAGTLTAGAWDDNRNFERFKAYQSPLISNQFSGAIQFTAEEQQAAQQEFGGVRPAKVSLDVALVIDTTGSMADELDYLETELSSISKTLAERFPNAAQRWSMIAYRDTGDAYVVRTVDFADGAEQTRNALSKQSAGGGGDTPEAPDAALAAMNQLSWRTGNDTAKLAFWVADAPHHTNKATDMLEAIRGARRKGIHLYPVSASGTDDLLELSMRGAAQLTGGRYLFLTDDSGVGGPHKEPSIPCYFVTRLDQAIVRMVDMELTGTYLEPTAEEVIRSAGDPVGGMCTLQSGEAVEAC
ncbi:MAG: vWA domain-containing protein [Myxococcales bacterium]